MPRIYAPIANRAARVTSLPRRADANVILYDGAALNIDYGSCVAQHDVIYQAPPRERSQGMPLGDGDLGAMLSCPDRLQFHLNKSDLWSDPTDGAEPNECRQASAGTVSVCSEPSFLRAPIHYEQRLSLQSGVITINSGNAHGACQITAFVSASTGVLVVRYKDQSVRNLERQVEVSVQRNAHLFALADTIGILQAFRDRRYALLARLTGSRSRATKNDANRCSLILGSARSCDFTLYVAVTTSPRDGDPVAMARSRIQTAIESGFDRLLAEQRHHWGRFWEKSFLRLHGADDDPLPGYLENLWYLGLYQQACCSSGFDAPLPNGGLFLGEDEARDRPAVYSGPDIRAMLANLISSNHLELSVPYVDTYFRLLPGLAARTGSECGLAGVRFPSTFSRFGDDVSRAVDESPERPIIGGEESVRPELDRPHSLDKDFVDPRASIAAPVTQQVYSQPAEGGFDHPCGPIATPVAQQVCEGLSTGLLVWEAWRHAPDRFFMCERVYPLLRAATVFALDQCQNAPQLWDHKEVAARLATAIRALLWADTEYRLGEEMRPEWQRIADRLVDTAPYYPQERAPFGALNRCDTIDVFRSVVGSTPQQASGFFGEDAASPDLAFSARLCAGLSGILLAERPIRGDTDKHASPVSVHLAGPDAAANHAVAGIAPIVLGDTTDNQRATEERPYIVRGAAVTPEAEAKAPSSFGGAAPAAIQVFQALPESWGGAFSLAAPGGFRISAEAAEGFARYVAVKSLLGGRCRVMNPWGAGVGARVLQHRSVLFDTDAEVIEFITEPNTAYLIERRDRPLSRAVSVRLTGRPNSRPKSCGACQLGILAVTDQAGDSVGMTRLPVHATEAVVVAPASRIALARERLRE